MAPIISSAFGPQAPTPLGLWLLYISCRLFLFYPIQDLLKAQYPFNFIQSVLSPLRKPFNLLGPKAKAKSKFCISLIVVSIVFHVYLFSPSSFSWGWAVMLSISQPSWQYCRLIINFFTNLSCFRKSTHKARYFKITFFLKKKLSNVSARILAFLLYYENQWIKFLADSSMARLSFYDGHHGSERESF